MTTSGDLGRIITFYSYKGGVGRTFSLVNVAVTLTRWGYRVCCVDWDLEAPGLGAYLDPFVTRRADGLVEMVGHFPSSGGLRWREFISELTIPDVGVIDMISAGADDDYSDHQAALDWPALYAAEGFAESIEKLRSEWRSEYDFVLVDSRTGLTDIGGICTVQVPDVLAVLYSTNRQSLEGAVATVERARALTLALPFDRSGTPAVPILSRADTLADDSVIREWSDRNLVAARQLSVDWLHRDVEVAQVLPHLRIPYYSRWSFGEELAVLFRESSGSP